ncbi:MerR family transcriptional regulator [Chloroflexota bacterium]
MRHQVASRTPRYNLSYVIHETGIKADTLRAWERRYRLPNPRRTEGGHRSFSDYDIQTIKWLIERKKEGVSISRAVQLWHEIEKRGDSLPSSRNSNPTLQDQTLRTRGEIVSLTEFRDEWIGTCLNYDMFNAERILTEAFAQFPVESVCVEILQSGLSKIGELWFEGKASVQQEHFASELTTQRIHALLADTPQPVRDETILVVCPPGENHTISALMTALFLRLRSWRVVYLGANVPHVRLTETIKDTNPDLAILVAMRLQTSVALSEMATFFNENDVPVAFGGWIFNRIPSLARKIPAYYLGGDLLEAISTIEKYLISGPKLLDLPANPEEYSETISHFNEHKTKIETRVLEKIEFPIGQDVSRKTVRDVNAYFSEDIIAALTLGDLSFIQTDLDWVRNLIANNELPGKILDQYLFTYYEAIQIHLGAAGKPIVEWLASLIQYETRREK